MPLPLGPELCPPPGLSPVPASPVPLTTEQTCVAVWTVALRAHAGSAEEPSRPPSEPGGRASAVHPTVEFLEVLSQKLGCLSHGPRP